MQKLSLNDVISARSVIYVSANNISKYINCHLHLIGYNFENFEISKEKKYVYTVNGTIERNQLKKAILIEKEGKIQSGDNGLMLNILCHHNLLPHGEYIISSSL